MPLTYIVSLWWRCLKPFWLCWMYALSSPVMSAVTHWSPLFPCNSNLVPLNQAFPPSTPSCSHFLIIIICSQLPLFFFKWCVCTCAHTNPMVLTWRRIQFPWYSCGGQSTAYESSLLPPCGDGTRVIKFGNKHVYPLIHLNTYIDHVLSGHT